MPHTYGCAFATVGQERKALATADWGESCRTELSTELILLADIGDGAAG